MRPRLGRKTSHDEHLRQVAERGLNAARRNTEPDATDAVPLYEEALAVLGRSRAILEGVADGVYITDPDGRIRLWNQSAERLTGCRESRALNRGCEEVLGLEMNGEPLDCRNGCALLRLHSGDESLAFETEVQRSRGGGREQQLLAGVSGVPGADGEVAEIVHTIRDITALKKADEAKTMFLSTASHELKTPLTVILGFAQILLDGSLPHDDQQTALEAIEKRAKELSRIVDRLLMTGRIDSGRILLTATHVDVRAILPERAAALATATERRIICEVADDVPELVGDPEAVATVVDHLLDNAVKYSPDGGDVVLRARKRGEHVIIEVTDPGVGMNPEEAAHCFDRFWQAEASDVRRFGGTGIGLYIVKSLVEGMGGSISVRSTSVEGSTFTVSLARARDGALPQTRKEQARPRGEGEASMIQEFMRQLGVPQAGGGGGS
ncbi:MAG: ATP-binding protein [Actinomycetota bacterium]